MCEAENKFVYDPINSDRPTDQFHAGVVRIAEDEMVAVEIGQGGPTNSASHLIFFISGSILVQ